MASMSTSLYSLYVLEQLYLDKTHIDALYIPF